MEECGLMASRIYIGNVMHKRLVPVGYRFVYKVFSLCVDLDTIAQEAERSSMLKLNRIWLFSLYTKDYGAKDGTAWREWIDRQLEAHGICNTGKVYLLCFPRVLGYTFNPLSVWYCEDREGKLTAVICEVSNTFGEKHHYLLHNRGKPVKLPLNSQAEKLFHVSPFIDMNKIYHFRFNQPASHLSVTIKEYEEDQLVLVATQTGKSLELTEFNLAKAFLMIPLLPFKIITMIHWHALRIWLRGANFYHKPESSKEGISQWLTKIHN